MTQESCFGPSITSEALTWKVSFSGEPKSLSIQLKMYIHSRTVFTFFLNTEIGLTLNKANTWSK